ncbi:MAG: DUF2461 domain-containing protein [Muribaculaceae bacterium]|nr:DUF2461 domain-containing protein [Muribaculaceae bacterium]
MSKIIPFLRSLRRHNDREWFNANKERYLKVKEEADSLAERLIALVAEVEPAASRMSARDVTYRIYRDTRFSTDKTPYKTHIGIFINPPHGKKSLRYGYYFHLEPDNSFICGGNMPAPAPLTKALRQSIYDNIEEYLDIVEDPEFKSLFPVIGTERLKLPPKGFPKDWEHIEYLKPKDFGTFMSVDDDFLTSPDAIDRLRPIVAQIKRLNDFINYTIDEYEEGL